MFHGSYRRHDVEFLLKPVQVEYISDLARKEALIQSGERHYSEMLSPEPLPSQWYIDFFRTAHAANRDRLAGDCLKLAAMLHRHHGDDVTIVSLARAGTPIGVIARHLIERIFGGRPSHYSLSIIRDRGIDEVALAEILSRGHSAESIAFVDGWTGKGVIGRELESSVGRFNERKGLNIDAGLYVLTDLAGAAAHTASGEDYLISSSILNGIISGLVSRSILNDDIGPNDFHGCVFLEQFSAHDLSRWYVDDVVAAGLTIHARDGCPANHVSPRAERAAVSRAYMTQAMDRYGIDDPNLIKPGIGEATRVLLRRTPERVIVRDPQEADVRHLVSLAAEKAVPVDVDPDLPYHTVSIIRSARHA